MSSSGSKRRSISNSCNINNTNDTSPSSSDRYDESLLDLEWNDDKKETATSWSAQMRASNINKPRTRRVYGSATCGSGINNGSARGRAPLARIRVADKVPQTLLQKLNLSSSYKRSSPASEAEDKLSAVAENYNPITAHQSLLLAALTSPLSDEATSSSVSKRKRITETLYTTATKVSTTSSATKEFAQSNSSASSPAFSSHSAYASIGFNGLSAAAAAVASSHPKNLAKFTSERLATYQSNSGSGNKIHMRFGSDPGGWSSLSAAYPSMSPNPAIDLRALLQQASYTQKENNPNHKVPISTTSAMDDTLHNECASIRCPMDKAIATNPTSLLDVKSKPTFMEHISSSSSSTSSDDDRVSKMNKSLFKSRRIFIAPRLGRNQLDYDSDDTSSDSSPRKDSLPCCLDVDDDDNSDEHLHSDEEVEALQQPFHSMITPGNPDNTFLQHQILETLPSRQVISYLLQQLHLMVKKQQRGTAASFITSYNNTRLTVVPPNTWNTTKRNELIKFATKTLGFTLRNASAGVEFLQIKTEKAIKIKTLIEAALRERKLRTHQGEEGGSKAITKVDETMTTNACLKAIPLVIYNTSISSTNKKSLGPLPRQKRESDFATENLPDISALRIESLDDGHSERIIGTSQPSNVDIDRLPRLSVEQSLPIQDILFHMAGDSPQPFCRINTDFKRRSGSKFYCHQPEEIPSFESILNHEIAQEEKATPLPTFSMNKRSKKLPPKRSFSERLSGELRRDCVISPLTPFPSLQKNRCRESRSSSCKKEELVITPMMIRTSQSYFCCSQHPSTVDWGASTRCDSSILEVLFLRFEAACARSTKDRKQQPSEQNSCINATPKFLPCTNKGGNQIPKYDDDCADDDDSIVPLLGSTHFGFVQEHYQLSLKRSQSSPADMHKRKRDSLAKLRRQSICKAMKEFCPRRLTSRPNAPFLLPNSQAIEDIMIDSSSCKVPSLVNEPPKLLVTEVCGSESSFQCDSYFDAFLPLIFDFLSEQDLLCKASLVCTRWADIAAYSLAKLMLISVGCRTDIIPQGKKEDRNRTFSEKLVEEISLHDRNDFYFSRSQYQSIVKSIEKSWAEMNRIFPWACFLAEGAYKKVYRVWNADVDGEEAISVMDVDLIESMGNKTVIGAELAVSVLLSSLARRNICPNFIITRGMFSCRFEPPSSHWGCAENKQPLGSTFDPSRHAKKPRQPHLRRAGNFQYIRMELCKFGDIENFIATQPNKEISPDEARHLLFQMAFSLYAASSQFGLKHYDVKLLNFFLQSANVESRDSKMHPFTILRYGVGHYIFDLKMPTARAYIAKLADYGTADLQQDTHGNSVTLGQFTTLENSPPEQLILGDEAVQGFGHDLFGLGLCMLHLFTGDAPYEEILQDVVCPPTLKKKLKQIWLSGKKSSGFCVIRSVILSDVFEDENDVAQGVPDETLYHTLYRYLVLFGIPKDKYQKKRSGSVWKAIVSCLGEHDDVVNELTDNSRRKPTDREIFVRDRSFYSFLHGSDWRISRAREKLKNMSGGVDLLLSLVEFNPERRASALDILNSEFMAPLRISQTKIDENDEENILYTFMAFHTPSGRHVKV